MNSEEIEKQMIYELENDLELYLVNCANKYVKYVEAAQVIFKDIYDKMYLFDQSKGNPADINYKAKELQKANELEMEIDLLQEAIYSEIYTPWTYERLAIIYSKQKEFEKAYKICMKWFELDYWKLPNTSDGSLRILKRINALEKKLNISNKL